jgi:hypothetical protein
MSPSHSTLGTQDGRNADLLPPHVGISNTTATGNSTAIALSIQSAYFGEGIGIPCWILLPVY